jgi:predicted  nucleic acid-binding Zn-ribbon protein
MDESYKEEELQNNDSNSESEEGNETENESESRVLEFFSDSSEEEVPNITQYLISLYRLTKIDSELEEIEEVKGDLPEKIKNLEDEVKDIEYKISLNQIKEKELTVEEEELFEECKMTEERMDKYDEQKYNVRSNKEYDDIMKAIDSCFEIVEKNETRIKEIVIQKTKLETELEELNANDKELKKELEENRKSLDVLNKQFEKEELELKEKRNEIIKILGAEDKHLYEKLNSTYKGEATSIVRNGNCSGCFNSIPPQREIEIRTATKIFTCQSCGRILIDESLIKS